MITSPGSPQTVQQFTDASADETYGPWVNVLGAQAVTFYFSGAGTTSSGVISIEESAPKDVTVRPNTPIGESAGSYSLITTKNASDITGTTQVAVHLPIAAYFYVRARISTVIGGGGTVSGCCVAY